MSWEEYGGVGVGLEEFIAGSSSGQSRVCDISPPHQNPTQSDDILVEKETTVIQEFPVEYEAGRTYG